MARQKRQADSDERWPSPPVDDMDWEHAAQQLALAISGSDLTQAVRRISCQSSCGADGRRRAELLRDLLATCDRKTQA